MTAEAIQAEKEQTAEKIREILANQAQLIGPRFPRRYDIRLAKAVSRSLPHEPEAEEIQRRLFPLGYEFEILKEDERSGDTTKVVWKGKKYRPHLHKDIDLGLSRDGRLLSSGLFDFTGNSDLVLERGPDFILEPEEIAIVVDSWHRAIGTAAEWESRLKADFISADPREYSKRNAGKRPFPVEISNVHPELVVNGEFPDDLWERLRARAIPLSPQEPPYLRKGRDVAKQVRRLGERYNDQAFLILIFPQPMILEGAELLQVLKTDLETSPNILIKADSQGDTRRFQLKHNAWRLQTPLGQRSDP